MKATSTHVVTPTARERASAARPALLIIAFVILVFFGLAALPDGRMNAVPVGIRNPTGDGARALAQVLKKHGVSVREVTAKQAATVGEDTTLVVFPSRMSHAIKQDVETRANVVYIGLEEEFGSSPAYLDGLSGDRGSASSTKVAPACASEIAGRAAEIIPSRYSVSGAGTNWQMCFTADGETYAYAERIHDGRFRAVIPDSVRVRNRGILEAGNAALALNAIGRTPKVAWYIASRTDGLSPAETTPTQSPYLAPRVPHRRGFSCAPRHGFRQEAWSLDARASARRGARRRDPHRQSTSSTHAACIRARGVGSTQCVRLAHRFVAGSFYQRGSQRPHASVHASRPATLPLRGTPVGSAPSQRSSPRPTRQRPRRL